MIISFASLSLPKIMFLYADFTCIQIQTPPQTSISYIIDSKKTRIMSVLGKYWISMTYWFGLQFSDIAIIAEINLLSLYFHSTFENGTL